jgi:hypothetical protein
VPLRITGHPPPEFTTPGLFTPSWDSSGRQDSVNLKSVLKGGFQGFTVESYGATYGDGHLLVDLKARGSIVLADAAWHVQLLPLGHVICDPVLDEYFMIFEVRNIYITSGLSLESLARCCPDALRLPTYSFDCLPYLANGSSPAVAMLTDQSQSHLKTMDHHVMLPTFFRGHPRLEAWRCTVPRLCGRNKSRPFAHTLVAGSLS